MEPFSSRLTTSPTTPPQQGERFQHSSVADQIEHAVDAARADLAEAIRKTRGLLAEAVRQSLK